MKPDQEGQRETKGERRSGRGNQEEQKSKMCLAMASTVASKCLPVVLYAAPYAARLAVVGGVATASSNAVVVYKGKAKAS